MCFLVNVYQFQSLMVGCGAGLVVLWGDIRYSPAVVTVSAENDRDKCVKVTCLDVLRGAVFFLN